MSEFQIMFDEELRQARYIINLPHAFESNSFDQYHIAVAPVLMMNQAGVEINENFRPLVEAMKCTRENLVQIADPESNCIYIWGNDMARAKDADAYDYTHSVDNEGFKPFLVPYLLKDQTCVKGNVIVIAGGGFSVRANIVEGYPVAETFNSLGYNAFVLQRRVEPSTSLDAFLDLQRSVRYLRYNAQALGIGGSDHIVACGFSGGAGTILGAIHACYGNIQPSKFYPNYTPDVVDAINSDLDAAIIMYGYGETPDGQSPLGIRLEDGFLQENPSLPPIFIGCGALDPTIGSDGSANLYNAVFKRTPTELHIFAGAEHGFGMGRTIDTASHSYRWKTVTNVTVWPALADTFMQIQFGKQQLNILD